MTLFCYNGLFAEKAKVFITPILPNLYDSLVYLIYKYFRPRGPLRWLDPGAFGTLGVGGGFALGAKLCRPDSQVWIIYGDGSLGYSIAEYDTFTRHKVMLGICIMLTWLFAEGKFCKNVGKTFHVGVIFHDASHISLIMSYGFYFGVGKFLWWR